CARLIACPQRSVTAPRTFSRPSAHGRLAAVHWAPGVVIRARFPNSPGRDSAPPATGRRERLRPTAACGQLGRTHDPAAPRLVARLLARVPPSGSFRDRTRGTVHSDAEQETQSSGTYGKALAPHRQDARAWPAL